MLTGAIGASLLVMLPFRLVNPSTATADSYCAAQCLDDANSAATTRSTTCEKSAFGTEMADLKALETYVASKIRFGGIGALLVLSELASYDVCTVVNRIRYDHDAGKCGEPNCGDPQKFPSPTTSSCLGCTPGYHCCVCRDYADGKPLHNVLVNGGYSCAVFCSTLGFTAISDTPC